MDDLLVRLARSSEADALTKLAMTAKASWGYSDAFMEACRAELTITPAKMAAWTVSVPQLDGTMCGMIALNIAGTSAGFAVEKRRHRLALAGEDPALLHLCGRERVVHPHVEQVHQLLGEFGR